MVDIIRLFDVSALQYLAQQGFDLPEHADDIVEAFARYIDAVDRAAGPAEAYDLAGYQVRQSAGVLRELVQELASRCGDASAEGLLEGVAEMEAAILEPLPHESGADHGVGPVM